MKSPIVITFAKPQDARGWIGLGCYTFVWAVLGMIALDKVVAR
jgi:hypothetical protein